LSRLSAGLGWCRGPTCWRRPSPPTERLGRLQAEAAQQRQAPDQLIPVLRASPGCWSATVLLAAAIRLLVRHRSAAVRRIPSEQLAFHLHLPACTGVRANRQALAGTASWISHATAAAANPWPAGCSKRQPAWRCSPIPGPARCEGCAEFCGLPGLERGPMAVLDAGTARPSRREGLGAWGRRAPLPPCSGPAASGGLDRPRPPPRPDPGELAGCFRPRRRPLAAAPRSPWPDDQTGRCEVSACFGRSGVWP